MREEGHSTYFSVPNAPYRQGIPLFPSSCDYFGTLGLLSLCTQGAGQVPFLARKHLDTLHMITFMPAPNCKGHFVWTQSHRRGRVVCMSPTPLEHSCTRQESIENLCNCGHVSPWPYSSRQIISRPTEMSCSLDEKLQNDVTLNYSSIKSVSSSFVYPLGFDFYR